MPQITKVKPKPTEESQRPEAEQLADRDAVTARLRTKRAELDEATEELLDAIDDVLAETDAQAFVAQFVQKGGQ